MDQLIITEYYNKKAKELDELRLTYENPNLYKQYFYNNRFNKIISVLSPQKGEKILDLGCGAGYYSRYLANLGCNVYFTYIS